MTGFSAFLNMHLTVEEEIQLIKTSDGPYEDGSIVNITCKVPRVRRIGATQDDMKVYLGGQPLEGSTVRENDDKTHTIFFENEFRVTPSHHNVMVICRFDPPNGTLQEDSLIIRVSSCKFSLPG